MQYLRDLGLFGRSKKSSADSDEEKGFDTIQPNALSQHSGSNGHNGKPLQVYSKPAVRSHRSQGGRSSVVVAIPQRGSPRSARGLPVSKSPCVGVSSKLAPSPGGTKRKHCLTPISSIGEDLGDSMDDFGDLTINDDVLTCQAGSTPIERQPVQRLLLPSGEYVRRGLCAEDELDDDDDVFIQSGSHDRHTPASMESPSDFIWMGGQRKSLSKEDYEGGGGRVRTSSISRGEDFSTRKLPTVFKWEGGGKNVYISGSFDNWKCKIPLVKSHGDFYTIIDLPEGQHQYKFWVDGAWQCDPNETQMDNDVGTKNNAVMVKASDFEVFEALAMDSNIGAVPTTTTTPSSSRQSNDYNQGLSGSPPGEYSQQIPPRNSGQGFHHSGPPILPPHLLQVILNKEIPLHCEPTLLPEPNHVMLNHLYALSIKDGVMVLSATHRYRKKYVTTLLYKPI